MCCISSISLAGKIDYPKTGRVPTLMWMLHIMCSDSVYLPTLFIWNTDICWLWWRSGILTLYAFEQAAVWCLGQLYSVDQENMFQMIQDKSGLGWLLSWNLCSDEEMKRLQLSRSVFITLHFSAFGRTTSWSSLVFQMCRQEKFRLYWKWSHFVIFHSVLDNFSDLQNVH